jgi:hypothetical protein
LEVRYIVFYVFMKFDKLLSRIQPRLTLSTTASVS